MAYISRFLLGTWVLRASNDKFLDNRFTTMTLKDDDTLTLKTISQRFMFAEKKSISAAVNVLSTVDNTASLDITYFKYDIYSHSAFGVQIPEIMSKNKKFTLKKKFNATIVDSSLLIADTRTPLYYLFDLQVGQPKSPYVEIGLTTFVFSQVFGLFLNSMITDVEKLF